MSAAVPGKVLLLVGARRTGKTFFIRQLLSHWDKNKCLLLNGEDIIVQQQLRNRSVANYKSLTAGYKYIIIDEAQKIPEIGLILKLMVDEINDIRLIVTGSSLFDLRNKLGEPLTGRKKDFMLFPIAQLEYNQGFVHFKPASRPGNPWIDHL